MEKLNFELMIASPYDREKLVVEINYGNYIQSYSLKPLKGCKFSN